MASIAVAMPNGGSSSRTVYRARPRRRAAARRRMPARRRRFPARRQARRGVMSKFTLANINPFDQNCDGAKVPDSNTYPSTPVKLEDEFPMIADAINGMSVLAYRPYATATTVTAVTAGASSWTWPAAFGGAANSSRLAQIVGNYSLFRPVAHGIRLSCGGASTSVAGFVHVCVYAENLAGTTWALPASVSQMNNCMYYQRYPLSMLTQRTLTIVNKFLDASATRYINPASDVAATSSDLSFHTEGWGTIIIAVEGATVSSQVLTVEQIIHAEALPLTTGINSATPAAAYDVRALQDVSRVAGSTPASFVQGEEQSYFAAVQSSLQQGINSVAMPALTNIAYGAGRYGARLGLSYIGRGIGGVTTARLQSGFRGGLNQLSNNAY